MDQLEATTGELNKKRFNNYLKDKNDFKKAWYLRQHSGATPEQAQQWLAGQQEALQQSRRDQMKVISDDT